MTRFISRQHQIKRPAAIVYTFLSDFNNFSQAIPAQYVSNWQADTDRCSFEINALGPVSMQFAEKKEYSLLKISNSPESKQEFHLWIQLKELNEADTRMKLTMDVKLNAMMKMMAKKPLEKFINTLAEQISASFNR